eukprot:scaffold53717_cov37-Phaeocystis_antarctica.AAC.2
MRSLLASDKEGVSCRVERRAYDAGRWERLGGGGVHSVNGGAGEVRLQIGVRARGGAHEEHVVHGCDAGRVEAQRLVERRRAEEHVAHVCDFGRVEAQRLVERRRVLPRVERRADTVR